MPKAKAKPPENVAAMTAYVDADGKTLLVLAELRGRARAFASEPPRRGRPPAGAEPPAPPAAQRAEAWAREFGAEQLEWHAARQVPELGIRDVASAAMIAVNADLERKRRSA